MFIEEPEGLTAATADATKYVSQYADKTIILMQGDTYRHTNTPDEYEVKGPPRHPGDYRVLHDDQMDGTTVGTTSTYGLANEALATCHAGSQGGLPNASSSPQAYPPSLEAPHPEASPADPEASLADLEASPTDQGDSRASMHSPMVVDAWAFGCYLPIAVGSTGVSASAWYIQASDGNVLETDVKPSRESNRRAWEAQIMAVVGVAESEHLKFGATVCLRITNKTLAYAIQNDFIGRKGPMAGGDYKDRLLTAIVVKRLRLHILVINKNADTVMEALAQDAHEAANLRLDEIGLEAAAAKAVRPMRRRRQSLFPPIEGRPSKSNP